VDAVRPVLVKRLARRANAGAVFRVVGEVSGEVVLGAFLRMGLVVERIRQRLVLALILKSLVALSHAVVGDQGGGSLRGQGLEVGFGVIAGVGRDERVGAAD